MMKLFEKIKDGPVRKVYLAGIKVLEYKHGERRKPSVSIAGTARVDSRSEIGGHTYIGDYVCITRTKVGRYCSIAPFVRIGLGEHDMGAISLSTKLSACCSYDDLTTRPCEIGDDVWIGTGAVVRRGVKVGSFSVIGANSFVNKDVPDFAVVAGVPARIVRLRFDAATRDQIIQSGYWRLEPDEARKRIATVVCDERLHESLHVIADRGGVQDAANGREGNE